MNVVNIVKLLDGSYVVETSEGDRHVSADLVDLIEEAATEDSYRVNRLVEKVNLMSGKTFRCSADTPLSCDPSTETYWSM